jgi:ubiquinone/menaquinone biosynthesis C-methylase UbiE
MALSNSSLYSHSFPSHPNCLTPSLHTTTLPFPIFKVNILNKKKQQQLRLRSSYSPKNSENLSSEIQSSATCGCGLCRRQFLGAFAGPFLSQFTTSSATADPSTDLLFSNAQKMMNKVHPAKPDWYEEFYAIALDRGMKSYDKEIAGYKEQLLNPLKGEAKTILELGIGTGPNIKYYASGKNVSVVGVDPNKHMEKYAQAAATDSGLLKSQFKFIHGVGEALPIFNSSMDAVVCTLVLCSVKDVDKTLKEVQRVLKPRGQFIFVEHVAAPDGTPLRFWQNLLDPLQQFVSDGCHLTRETGEVIRGSGFSDASINMTYVPSVSLISPHVFGTAYK